MLLDMRRRRALQSLVAIPAASLLPAQVATPVAAQEAPKQPPSDEHYKIDLTTAEAVSPSTQRFFNAGQYAALTKLCAAIFPAVGERPGAVECEVPEFLDFLIGSSPAEVQSLYKQGLDHLTASGVDGGSLKPLTQAWTYNPPADPMARFLLAAKDDVIRATFNSRTYAEAAAQGRRRSAGTNYYWLPLE